MSAALYNRDILSLAVATADFPPLAAPHHRVSARAPLCGSAIILDLDTDEAGHVTAVGLHVEACALGQASAALLARHAPGQSLDEIRAARDAILAVPDQEAAILAVERDPVVIRERLMVALRKALHGLADEARTEAAGGTAERMAA